MASPWAALPAGTDARAVDRQVRAAREGFLAHGVLDTRLRHLVAESWRRCVDGAAGLSSGTSSDLGDDELEEYRRHHPLAIAMPVVRRLLVEDADDAGLIVALTDARGRLLWVEGASGSRRRAEGFGFVEGADWSEAAAGTNAPGTALALDHPVQIFAAEHLAGPVTDWSCAAAPVHDPQGRLLGAIDLTGGNEVAAPHTLTLVRTVAAAVEAELRLHALRGPERPGRPGAGGMPRSAAPAVERRRAPRPAPTAAVRLRILGHPTGELVTPDGVTALRLRHAEILLLLSLHPAGLTADQLALQLHDRRTAPVTLRAELSRLRDLLARQGGGVGLTARPYRLTGALDSDLAEVRGLLRRGAYRRALAGLAGAVLPESTAPGVEEVRERLRQEVRACLLAGRDAELLWAHANSPEGAGDLEIWQACRQALPTASRRLPVVRARIRQLDAELS